MELSSVRSRDHHDVFLTLIWTSASPFLKPMQIHSTQLLSGAGNHKTLALEDFHHWKIKTSSSSERSSAVLHLPLGSKCLRLLCPPSGGLSTWSNSNCNSQRKKLKSYFFEYCNIEFVLYKFACSTHHVPRIPRIRFKWAFCNNSSTRDPTWPLCFNAVIMTLNFIYWPKEGGPSTLYVPPLLKKMQYRR